MGRKKKKPLKPWCWYCEREFENEKILIDHQRAKHFRCHICAKKLFTSNGLAIHCLQVHKEHLDKVLNALPGRDTIDPNLDIYGMDNVPEIDLERRKLQKQGNLASKKDTLDNTDDGLVPGIPGAMPGMIPPGPMPSMMMPGMMMPHIMPGMIPPGMMIPPRIPPPPPAVVPGSHIMQPNARPLFPSAAQVLADNPAPSIGPVRPSTTVAPVPSSSNTAAAGVAQQSVLIHPDDDLSLEERRAEMAKYKMRNSVSRGKTSSGTGLLQPPPMMAPPVMGMFNSGVPGPPGMNQSPAMWGPPVGGGGCVPHPRQFSNHRMY